MMNTQLIYAIWIAGAIHIAIALTNFTLPATLHVREGLVSVPRFLQQVFYVHWGYIVLTLLLFAALCLGFAPELAGASALGRFLSGFIAAFWLLRIILQYTYYEAAIRRQHRFLYSLYAIAVVTLIVVLGFAAIHPTA